MRAELGKEPTRAPQSQLYLPPGFRFYPTDEELVVHYLCKKAACEPFAVPIIAEVELYKFDPWVLPDKALFGEREWYFFSPRDRKYPNGSRPNRAAGGGYWKATGTDKPISTLGGRKKVGVKKALVFYKGKAPKGVKTNWIMHEYRLADAGTSTSRPSAKRKGNLRLDDWVLCRIYKKSSSAANQEKEASDSLDDIQAEQSESSSLDDVLATLSELDDQVDHPVDALSEEAEGAHADMAQFGCLERQNFSLQSSMERLYYESVSAYSSQEDGLRHNIEDLSAYSSQGDGLRRSMEDLGGMAKLESSCNNGNAKEYGLQDMRDAGSFIRRENVGTPESNMSSRQYSPPIEYSQSTSGQQEEEKMREDDTLNALARLPLTQLLNTQNLGGASNPLFGLDLGLPSPCTMLAQGSSFGGSLMSVDPDSFLFQSTYLTTGDPNRIHF